MNKKIAIGILIGLLILAGLLIFIWMMGSRAINQESGRSTSNALFGDRIGNPDTWVMNYSEGMPFAFKAPKNWYILPGGTSAEFILSNSDDPKNSQAVLVEVQSKLDKPSGSSTISYITQNLLDKNSTGKTYGQTEAGLNIYKFQNIKKDDTTATAYAVDLSTSTFTLWINESGNDTKTTEEIVQSIFIPEQAKTSSETSPFAFEPIAAEAAMTCTSVNFLNNTATTIKPPYEDGSCNGVYSCDPTATSGTTTTGYGSYKTCTNPVTGRSMPAGYSCKVGSALDGVGNYQGRYLSNAMIDCARQDAPPGPDPRGGGPVLLSSRGGAVMANGCWTVLDYRGTTSGYAKVAGTACGVDPSQNLDRCFLDCGNRKPLDPGLPIGTNLYSIPKEQRTGTCLLYGASNQDCQIRAYTGGSNTGTSESQYNEGSTTNTNTNSSGSSSGNTQNNNTNTSSTGNCKAPSAPSQPSNNPLFQPSGCVELSKSTRKVDGWAYNPDTPGKALKIRAYYQKPGQTAMNFIGEYAANTPNADFNRAPFSNIEGGTNHGFEFTLPSAVQSGDTVIVYAVNNIDPVNGWNVLIGKRLEF